MIIAGSDDTCINNSFFIGTMKLMRSIKVTMSEIVGSKIKEKE